MQDTDTHSQPFAVARRLSSGATLYFKVVLPVLLFVGGAALFLAALTEGIGGALFVLVLLAVGGFFTHQFLLPLKRVVAVGDGLDISNYRATIHIPFTDIQAVHRAAKRWDIIEVWLREPTPFGRSIMFMAGARLFWWPDHPVVTFLRRRAGLSENA